MENIALLMMELPAGYEEECYKQGAIVRRRGVSKPADLMMLAVFHLQNGCSLLEMSEVARITKLGSMSDVAFMKRFGKCGGWFRSINEKLAGGIYCYRWQVEIYFKRLKSILNFGELPKRRHDIA